MVMIRRLGRIVLLVVLLGLFFFQQNCTFSQEQVALRFSGLPREFSGLRVLQLSDLHGRTFGTGNGLLLDAAVRARPDLICITGDLFEEETELTTLEPLIRRLCDLAPVFYVTGNHEWQRQDLKECLKELERWGAVVLRNEYRLLVWETAAIAVLGVDDPCGPYDQKTPAQLMEELRREQGEDCFVLALDHRNDRLDLWRSLGADLVLSGHCHGGVIRLPFVGGLIGPDRGLFPDYDAGLYCREQTQLYVSRGLGFPLRLFNRPHLPVLILNRK